MKPEEAKKALREWIEKEEEFLDLGFTECRDSIVPDVEQSKLTVTDAKRLIGLLLDVIDGPSQTESFKAKSQT